MPATLGEIAEEIDAELEGDPGCKITNVAALHDAGAGYLSFLANRRYYPFLKTTRASAVVLAEGDAPGCSTAKLVSSDPYLSYAKAARFLNPPVDFNPYIHPSAVVYENVNIPAGCFIGANSVIGKDVSIGDKTYIGPGCVIGEKVVIGSHCRLHANITLLNRIEIGERVVIHPGVVIGADGFGIANDGEEWLKIPQLGSVIIRDDVEIGANTTIDRGALGNTMIEAGVKIDNQVQVGHNTKIGAHTAVAGCVGFAGSVKVGKRCMIGGASAIAGHIEIADDVVITGMSGVSSSIKKAGVYSSGITITDNKTWRKNMVRFKQLDKIVKRFFELENNIKK